MTIPLLYTKKDSQAALYKMQPGCLFDFDGKTRGFPTPSFGGSGYFRKIYLIQYTVDGFKKRVNTTKV